MKERVSSIIKRGGKIMKYHRKNTFKVFAFRTVLFACVSVFLLLSNPGEGDTDCKEHFRQGRKDLEALRYSEAVSNLSLAQKEFPLLEDYTLYYLAEAYHGTGRSSGNLLRRYTPFLKNTLQRP